MAFFVTRADAAKAFESLNAVFYFVPLPVTIARPLEVPSRIAPAAIIASAVCASRMPPEAFTPNFAPTAGELSFK